MEERFDSASNGWGFESLHGHQTTGGVPQLAEDLTQNQDSVGSNPTASTNGAVAQRKRRQFERLYSVGSNPTGPTIPCSQH